MNDVVYVVIEDDGDYECPYNSVSGVFTNIEDARKHASESDYREVQTWTTGPESAQQKRNLHIARHEIANPGFNVYDEIQWRTFQRVDEVDASEAVESSDAEHRGGVQRGGWTAEHAEQRLAEALKTFTPDLTPRPARFRWTLGYREHFANS